jgi:hypothetical protein
MAAGPVGFVTSGLEANKALPDVEGGCDGPVAGAPARAGTRVIDQILTEPVGEVRPSQDDGKVGPEVRLICVAEFAGHPGLRAGMDA